MCGKPSCLCGSAGPSPAPEPGHLPPQASTPGPGCPTASLSAFSGGHSSPCHMKPGVIALFPVSPADGERGGYKTPCLLFRCVPSPPTGLGPKKVVDRCWTGGWVGGQMEERVEGALPKVQCQKGHWRHSSRVPQAPVFITIPDMGCLICQGWALEPVLRDKQPSTCTPGGLLLQMLFSDPNIWTLCRQGWSWG